ncbi:MAG: hypothetical protein Q8K72_09285, partial [Acidimicrobiales bacterium]|nr:hypothetical protein [Acidimicrobiales bacterium]
MATDDYHFITEWRAAATIEEVKDVLGDAPSLTRWWPAVYLELTEVEPGGLGGVGLAVDLHTKGWLPYTLQWRLRITEPMTDAGFALSAEGDLEGTGERTFRQEGPEVVIINDSQVHASK